MAHTWMRTSSGARWHIVRRYILHRELTSEQLANISPELQRRRWITARCGTTAALQVRHPGLELRRLPPLHMACLRCRWNA